MTEHITTVLDITDATLRAKPCFGYGSPQRARTHCLSHTNLASHAAPCCALATDTCGGAAVCGFALQVAVCWAALGAPLSVV